jgi:hypothetical protein
MTFLRNILLSAGLLVLAACATQTFKPDQAPEYEITRSFTPFYQQRPIQGARTDISLNAKTRVKLLRKGMGYSFVQLEDSRTGYVANKNMAVAPPGSQKKPFGSTSDEAPTKPRRKKRPSPTPSAGVSPTPSPSPVSQGEQLKDIPSHDVNAPSPTPPPDLPKAPPEVPAPSPTPTPQPPLEKPKFRL